MRIESTYRIRPKPCSIPPPLPPTLDHLLTPPLALPSYLASTHSGIERALAKHSSGSTSSAFAGQGQTLGSSSSSSPSPAKADGPSPANAFTNLDPQVKVLLGLIGAYLLFWYMS